MSYIDNDPPRHANVGHLRNPDRLNVHKQLNGITYHRYFVALSALERKAIILMGEKPILSGHTTSKKVYNKALNQQYRARLWIEEQTRKRANGEDHVL